MGSQLEGLGCMALVAIVGGILGLVIYYIKSTIAIVFFAYIGTHFITALILSILFAIFFTMANIEKPPFPFFCSMLLLIIIPAMISAPMAILYYWAYPTGELTIEAYWIGIIASPFLLLGIGGTAIESLMTLKKRDKTNP